MASTIKLKNGSGAPTTGDLVQGEPALDLTNKRLYTENASGVVIEVGTNPSTIDINAGTIDGTVIGGTTPAAVTTSSLVATTADINAGTIDGTVIGGTTAAAGTFTTITASGEITANGGIALGDGDVATFGDSDDLSIFHAGGTTYLTNTTGSLVLRTDSFRVLNTANSEQILHGDANGAVRAYYDNAEKLVTTATGIDVTGTVTADGLTVDLADNAGALLQSPNDSSTAFLKFGDSTSSDSGSISYDHFSDALRFKTINTSRMILANNGDISFYEDTGTTAKFFWDASAESLGIGTSSPSARLHLKDTTGSAVKLLELETAWSSPSGNKSIEWTDATNTLGRISVDYTSPKASMRFGSLYNSGYQTGDVMTLTADGNVGIGTSSPSTKLEVAGAVKLTNGNLSVAPSTATQAAVTICTNTGGSFFAGLDSSTGGTFGVGNYSSILYNGANTPMVFFTNGTERMRIDASGNLLVGCTSLPSASVKGAAFLSSADQGRLYVSADSTAARDLAYFINPNGVIGTITTTSSSTAYNTSSDYRLKENITDANDAGDKIDAIKVRQYDWKADGSHQDYGMVAQELMTVAPEAVSGDPESDEMMGVDYSKLVPMMLKEIQSLRARVAQLEGAN